MEAMAKAAIPVSAPSIAPQSQARRRAIVRAPLPAPNPTSSEFRVARDAPLPPRSDRFGWLFTVFRSRA